MAKHILVFAALTAFAALAPPSFAQGTSSVESTGTPGASSTSSSDDAMTDVDPTLLTRCKGDATRQKLKGEARDKFVRMCVQPED